MAQIKKDKKQSDNQRISSLTLENDNLLQSAEVEQSRKDLAKAVVDFAQQVIDSEEFTGRDLRIYNLGIQEAVNKILKGELAYSESMTGDARTNIFGYYSRHGQPSELDWMVNETVKRGSKGNLQDSQSQDVSTPMRQIVTLSPAAGFSSYVLPSTTVDQKVKKFASHLAGQLTNYLRNPYDESQYIIKGINKDSIRNFLNYLTSLSNISGKTNTAEDILTLGDIVSAIGNEDLTNAFESYFKKELSGEEITPQTVTPTTDSNVISQETTPIVDNNSSDNTDNELEETSEKKLIPISNGTEAIHKALNNEIVTDAANLIFLNTMFGQNPLLKEVIKIGQKILPMDLIKTGFTQSINNITIDDQIADFIKLSILAENGDDASLATLRNKYPKAAKKHGNMSIGDYLMKLVKSSDNYNIIVNQYLNNTTNEKEKQLFLKELQKTKKEQLETPNTSRKTYFSSASQQTYPMLHRTYSEKRGGKLDKLRNYINNKNGK